MKHLYSSLCLVRSLSSLDLKYTVSKKEFIISKFTKIVIVFHENKHISAPVDIRRSLTLPVPIPEEEKKLS